MIYEYTSNKLITNNISLGYTNDDLSTPIFFSTTALSILLNTQSFVSKFFEYLNRASTKV